MNLQLVAKNIVETLKVIIVRDARSGRTQTKVFILSQKSERVRLAIQMVATQITIIAGKKAKRVLITTCGFLRKRQNNEKYF